MSKFPDYAANDISVQEIHRALLSHGCCLLRKALDPSVILKYSDLIEAIYQKKAHLVHTENLQDDNIKSHIYEPEFQQTYPGQSLYDLLKENAQFFPLLDSLFGSGKFHHSPVTN